MPDRAVVRLPWREALGTERVNGGAIATLVDSAATCAFWSHPDIGPDARGATVGFSINYLALVVRSALTATATVRRRGGSLCVGEVTVHNEAGQDVAIATVTYKLEARRHR